MKVVAITKADFTSDATDANKFLIVSERGAFGSPIMKHALAEKVVAVEVCRGAAIRFGPAAATGRNHFTVAVSENAECQGYDGPTATDGRYCRLRVADSNQLLSTLSVGDVARRVAQGRTKVASDSSLINGGTSLKVEDAAALMGAIAIRMHEAYSDGFYLKAAQFVRQFTHANFIEFDKHRAVSRHALARLKPQGPRD